MNKPALTQTKTPSVSKFYEKARSLIEKRITFHFQRENELQLAVQLSSRTYVVHTTSLHISALRDKN